MDLDKTYLHRNFTIRKALYFAISGGIGALVTVAITYAFTEWVGLWYIYSVILAGGLALTVKFIINALWTFKD